VIGYIAVMVLLFLIFFGGFIVHVVTVARAKRKGKVFNI